MSKPKLKSTARAPMENENQGREKKYSTKTAFDSFSIGYATKQLLLVLLLLLLIAQNAL